MSDVQRYYICNMGPPTGCVMVPGGPGDEDAIWIQISDYAALAAKERAAYYDGMEAGIRLYAWWKDGVQYVGSCGRTLERALTELRAGRRP